MRIHEGNISDGRMVVLCVVVDSNDPSIIWVYNPQNSEKKIDMPETVAVRLAEELKHAAEKSRDASSALAMIAKQERNPEAAR